MDIVLHYTDEYVFTPYVYPPSWSPDDIWRQTLSLFLISTIGGYILYFILASFSFFFLFDRRLMRHPLFLKNQIRHEIAYTCKSVPIMAVPTVAVFLFEVRGYSKLFDNTGGTLSGYLQVISSLFTFIVFTDMCIYWIHYFLHNKHVYRFLHKDHHRWKVPTPFASHAFHPMDGFLQSCPYHIYVFLFPMHKVAYLCMFVFVNFWTVSIHDGNYRVPDLLKPFVNGSAHHMDHHLYYNYNYGQFFTLWDRIGGSFRTPSSFVGEGPIKTILEREKWQTPKGCTTKAHGGIANGHDNKKEE